MDNTKMEQTKSDIQNEVGLCDDFVNFYISVPFGSMSKTNIDAYVYGLLEKSNFFKDCNTAQDIAVKLKITPAKVRNLMLNSALIQNFQEDSYTLKILELLGSSSNFMDNNFITININDARVKMALQIRCANLKIMTNDTFNQNIIIFPIRDYAKLLESFIPKGQEKKVNEELWNKIKGVKHTIRKQEIMQNPIVKILKNSATGAISNAVQPIIVPATIATVVGAIYKLWKNSTK